MDLQFTLEDEKLRSQIFLWTAFGSFIYLFSQSVSQNTLGEYPDAVLGAELEICISLTPGLSRLMF